MSDRSAAGSRHDPLSTVAPSGFESALRSRSLWLDQLPGPLVRRPALGGDASVDVAIVGGGYTGLWTAYAVLCRAPDARVMVIERDAVGFGASGRNGGWCVGELAGGLSGAIERAGVDGGRALTGAVIDTIDDIAAVIDAERIDCGFTRGGVLRLARNEPQLRRQRVELDEFRRHGFGPDVIRALDVDEAFGRLRATRVRGALWYGPGARVQPAALVRGLAEAVERRGGTIVEGTAAVAIVAASPTCPAMVVTGHGTVRADTVVQATEAYTRDLPGQRRRLVPLYSLMLATEPLDADMWDEIGLERRETFSDDRRMVIYGQRTVDDRLAFGGRGAPYRYGSRIDAKTERSQRAHEQLAETLTELIPAARGVAISHRWGGVLGVPRDWRPSVGLDRARGLGWAGGYVGEGVAASNLAGRTLADLIVGADSELVGLGWVGHRSPRWEPEPARWAGIEVARRLAVWADRVENDRGHTPRLASVVDRFLG